MKKILLYIDGLDSGGAQRQLIGLAIFLKRNGKCVRLISFKKNANFYEEQLKQAQIEYSIECNNGISTLYRNIKSFRPDVIISFLGKSNLYSCIVKLINKTPLIVSERNTTTTASFFDKIRFFLYRYVDSIVPNSYSQSRYIVSHYPYLKNKVFTIINFVDTDKFHPLNRERSNSLLRIITVARVVPQKNVLGYIDAVKQVLDKINPNFVIEWYGDLSNSDYVAKCRKKIDKLEMRDRFKFMGEEKNIQNVYQVADAFCLPSFYEGTPNVICEAMACGLPVLCSNVCDNAMYVTEDNGILFNPNETSTIADALINFITLSTRQREEMRLNSRHRAVESFSVVKFTEKYLNVINSVC